ncbi:cytochrome c [Sphingosinicellaceae bacterium]|nr:cytochrome c [Sphingosinicellaceae bacterium]
MSWFSNATAALLLALPVAAVAGSHPDFGRAPSPAEQQLWDIDVRPDGQGLPPGSGTAAQGRELFQTNCEGCHGVAGVGGPKDRLVGGKGSLATDKPIKTIGSYWPYATTLFDYIRRAMPYQAPGSLSADETYAVVAYLLNLNGIVPDTARLDRASLVAVRMPNRDGFIPDQEYRHVHPTKVRWAPHGVRYPAK